MQILQGTGDNFRSARAAFVHQDGQRKARSLLRAGSRGIIALLRGRAALRRNDCCAGRQKLRANIHRAVQEAAGIVAQIENEALHPLFLQSVQRFGEFIGSRIVELHQSHVADLELAAQVRIQQPHSFHAIDLDVGAIELVFLDLLG